MRALTCALALLVVAACSSAGGAKPELVIGAVYPLAGPQAEGGRQELGGVRAALTVAGLGKRVQLDVVSAETPQAASAAVDRLIDQDHVSVIVGTYGSTLSEAAAARADQRHVVYWETGAVADLVTQHRRYVFRTVATGMTLGTTAVTFTDQVLLPAAALAPQDSRAVIVNADDVYGRSVADAEQQLAAQLGIPVVARVEYDPNLLDPAQVADSVAAAQPDYLWDVSYLDDGIAIWRAILKRGVALRAAVGTSSAFCMPEFGQRLGWQALGVYAADKPDDQVSSAALTPAARKLLQKARTAYAAEEAGVRMSIPAVAGFVGGWTLFHEVLARVKGPVTPDALRQAAYQVDDPMYTSINGGGVKFAGPDQPNAGQNLRAPSVVGQWQGLNRMKTVYPASFADGTPKIS